VLEPGAGRAAGTGAAMPGVLSGLAEATTALVGLDASLRGVPGLTCLLGDRSVAHIVGSATAEIELAVSRFEAVLDSGSFALPGGHLEGLNAALVALRDATWALGHDRIGAARDVMALAEVLGLTEAGATPGPAALAVLWAVNVAFRALDRLEVRGRDSAGVHLMVSGHGLDLGSAELAPVLASRSDPLFSSLSARPADGCLSVVYKAAAEIGELGDNVASLRRAVGADPLLALALRSPAVTATVVAHTRWASMGLVSQANAHPLNSDEEGSAAPGPYVVGVLNGDIDNYAQLVGSEGARFPAGVTTDAKLVPTLVSRHLATGVALVDGFREAAARFDGSIGIAANASCAPGELLLALRGSGQSLNIGLAEDAFVVASEPYGLVEETSRYLRMDGEGGGQVVECSAAGAGALAGIARWDYQGNELAVSEAELKVAEITTRDVDRGGFSHFFLKEISESPSSVRKTLRGKLLIGESGSPVAHLGDDVIPPALREALASGLVHSAVVIGQGTAAVAGRAVAVAVARALPQVPVVAMPATELSGWGSGGTGLPDDMSGALVIAISQSGTTTDTNRSVDLVRARGAHVVAIVNRRNSDLVQKSHGVLYTSDGRDVEMAVASTKAFYAQVVAGYLLAAGLGQAAGVPPGEQAGEQAGTVLGALRELPSLMQEVLALRPRIAAVACALAPSRRSWAVVGSGPDQVAAAEVRIKLSELCYKAVALDYTEDKKHIDLSSEPLVIVCATAASGPNAHDIAKEVEIFRAHKAAPVVIVGEGGQDCFGAGLDVLRVPRCHPELDFVFATMVGHIFGYEAALCIDRQARPLRAMRVLLENATRRSPAGDGVGGVGGPDLEHLAPALELAAAPVLSGTRDGAYDGSLDASTATRLVVLLRYATGALPVEGYEAEMGKVGTPEAIVADLLGALGAAIDELTRPIDAIKHQAKTVTVGISRNEDALVRSTLVAEALGAGASIESLGYSALRALAALGPAVEQVLGYTRYRIDVPAGVGVPGMLQGARIVVVGRGGISIGIGSRTDKDSTLRGTKHRAAQKRQVTAFKGLHDGRTGVIIPEAKSGRVTGITLLHARFAERLAPEVAERVLRSYQGRYAALVDAVTETCPRFDDQVLGEVPVTDLLTEPVAVLARRWSC